MREIDYVKDVERELTATVKQMAMIRDNDKERVRQRKEGKRVVRGGKGLKIQSGRERRCKGGKGQSNRDRMEGGQRESEGGRKEQREERRKERTTESKDGGGKKRRRVKKGKKRRRVKKGKKRRRVKKGKKIRRGKKGKKRRRGKAGGERLKET